MFSENTLHPRPYDVLFAASTTSISNNTAFSSRCKLGVIRLTFLSFEFNNDSNGPEDFLLNDLHLGCAVRKDGGLDEVPLLAMTLPSYMNRSTFLFTSVNVSHDTLMHEVSRDILMANRKKYVKLGL